MTLVYSVILFCIMIFPHELGHFIAAKSVGIKVNEFALGMGPTLLKKQKGETQYTLRAIPIGGYCAMEGENEESSNNRAFNNKSVPAKILVLVAGSLMNVLIAILVLSILIGKNGVPTTTIAEVTANGPAYEVGIKGGDRIISIDNVQIEEWKDINEMVGKQEESLTISVERDNKLIDYDVIPVKYKDGRMILGITSQVTKNPFICIKEGGRATWNLTKGMYDALGQLFTAKASPKDLAGPIGIISLVNDTKNNGLSYFGYLTALISINLAIVNMLPFPALDGGRILFVIIRKVTGKMISDDLEGKIHMIGMALLLALMLFATWNDITRLFL